MRSGRPHAACSRKSDTTTTRPGIRATRARRCRAPARPSGSPSPSWATPVSRRRRSASVARRPPRGGTSSGEPAPNVITAEAAGPPQGQAAHGQRDALGHVGLQPLGCPERHRGGDVEREPCGQRALGDLEAHVGHGRPRARRGVDLADVVADLVRAQLRQLGPDPGAGGGTVAGQQPARAPREPQLHGIEQRGRHPARALAGRGWAQPLGDRAHAARAPATDSTAGSSPTGGASGTSTVARIRSRMSSALTPSPSAS